MPPTDSSLWDTDDAAFDAALSAALDADDDETARALFGQALEIAVDRGAVTFDGSDWSAS